MEKTFNIGEYAVGGKVKVETYNSHNEDRVLITCVEYDSEQPIKSAIFRVDQKREIAEYLETEVTTYYYSEKIMDYINQTN